MFRSFLCIILCLTFLGCSDKASQNAERLYALVDYYGQERQYDQAIATLQRIRIDYENTDLAAKAEDEIGRYQELKDILIRNQKSRLKTGFEGIGRALENYKTRYQAYPLTSSDLDKLPSTMIPEWDDPWGNPIYYKPVYSSPSVPRHSPDNYVLASFGGDGLPGGKAQDKDFFFQEGNIIERMILE